MRIAVRQQTSRDYICWAGNRQPAMHKSKSVSLIAPIEVVLANSGMQAGRLHTRPLYLASNTIKWLLGISLDAAMRDIAFCINS